MRRPLAIAIALVVAAALATAAVAGRFHAGRLLLAVGLPGPASLFFDDPAWRGVALLAAGRPGEAAMELRRTRSREAAYNLGNALALSGDWPRAVKAYDLALARDPADEAARLNKAIVEAAIAAARVSPAGGQPARGGVANSGADKEHDPGRDDATTAEQSGAMSVFGDGMIGNRESGSTSDAGGSSKVGRQGTGQQDASEGGAGDARGSAGAGSGETGRGAGSTTAAEGDSSARMDAASTVDESRQATLQWLAAIPDDPARFLKRRIGAERDRRVAAGTAVQPGGDGW